MVATEGYQEVFRPFLEAKMRESFPDPSKFTSEKEFLYAAMTASVFKKVIAELLGWVDMKLDEGTFLEKKAKGETKQDWG